ncbi:MAG: helix-turn-helix domain-containing protein [Candidatus Adiutrix sp.]|nr:helix-turn-helix domain-containing protein [Candidatus Adiutrix sp.]
MKRYTVGDVSRITGVSKDMLRFYDKIGLVKPAYTDPLNNYRYYDYGQFWLIDIIQLCRGLDVPLKEIGLILQCKDDDKVLELLMKHREEAINRSRYFKRVAEDIDWYAGQRNQMRAAYDDQNVTIRHVPARQVLLGKDDEDTHLYHLKLQKLCRSTLKTTDSLCRHYGFVLDVDRMRQNSFIKQAEYLCFDEDILKEADPSHLTTLPGGDYACFVVNVINDTADFAPLLQWCEKEKVAASYVIADEIGLHLFDYLDQNYLCEAKVLLKHK